MICDQLGSTDIK